MPLITFHAAAVDAAADAAVDAMARFADIVTLMP